MRTLFLYILLFAVPLYGQQRASITTSSQHPGERRAAVASAALQWATGYDDGRRVKITVSADSAEATSDIFEAVIPFSMLSDTAIKRIGSDPGDIRVTIKDKQTMIPSYAVGYDSASKAGHLYFNPTTLAAQDSFFIYYGIDASAPAVTNSLGRNAVFDSAEAYYTLEADSTTIDTILYSATGSHHLSFFGDITTADVLAGSFGTAIDFDGSDYLYSTTPAVTDTPIVISAWIHTPASTGGPEGAPVVGVYDIDGTGNRRTALSVNNYGPSPRFTHDWGSSQKAITGSSGTNSTFYVVGVVDGNGLKIYQDGELKTTEAISNSTSGLDRVMIGAREHAGTLYEGHNEWVDEVWIGAVIPDSSEIRTKWRMMQYPATFWTVGEDESIGDAGGSAPAANDDPTANFTPGISNLQVTFTDASTDGDGTVTTWSWTFGDGNTSTAQNPTHTYSQGGSYTVRLTVGDNDGATDSYSTTLFVDEPTQTSDYLLNQYTDAYQGWSLRKMDSTYTGNVVRLRRSGDNQEQDFGLSGDDLDISAIEIWLGPTDTAFVDTWYSQTGGSHLTQSNTTLQPYLAINGAVLRDTLNKPYIQFIGSKNTYLEDATNFSSAIPLYDMLVFAMMDFETATGNSVIYSFQHTESWASLYGLELNHESGSLTVRSPVLASQYWTGLNQEREVLALNLDGGTIQSYISPNKVKESASVTGTTTQANFTVGIHTKEKDKGYNGRLSEIVVFPGQSTALKVQARYDLINSYWQTSSTNYNPLAVLPQKYDYQIGLYDWMETITTDSVALPTDSIVVSNSYTSNDTLADIWMALEGASASRVVTQSDTFFTLDHIQRGDSIAIWHEPRSGHGNPPRSWANEGAFLYQMHIPLEGGGEGNGYYQNRALGIRALVVAMVDMMQYHKGMDGGSFYVRTDMRGKALLSWAETYRWTKDILPDTIQTDFEDGLTYFVRAIRDRGAQAVNTNMDMFAVQAMAEIHQAANDTTLQRLAVEAAKFILLGKTDGTFRTDHIRANTITRSAVPGAGVAGYGGWIMEGGFPEYFYNGESWYHLVGALAAVMDRSTGTFDADWQWLEPLVRANIKWQMAQSVYDPGRKGYQAHSSLPVFQGPGGYNGRTASGFPTGQADFIWKYLTAASMFTEARPFLYRAAGGGIDRGNVAKRLPTVSEMLSDAASKASSLTNNLNTEYTTDPVQWNGWSPWAKANAYFPVKGWYSTLKALSDTPDNTVRFPFEKDTTFYHLTGTTDYPEFISVKDSLDDGREFGYVIELLESMGAYGGWVGGKIEAFWTEKTGRVIFNYHDKSGSGSMIFDDIENYLVHHLWGMDENGNRFSTAFLRGPADSTGRVLSADSANGRFSIKTAFNYDPDLTTTRSGEEDPSVLTGGVSVYSVFEKLDTGLKFTHDIRSDGTDSLKYLHSTIPVYLKAAGNVTGDKPQSLLQDTEISYWNGSAWATMPEDGIDSDTLPDYVTTNALRLMRNYELGEGEQSVYIDLSTTYDVRLADTSWYSSYQGQVKGRAVHISLIDNPGTLQPIPTINTTVEYTIVLDDPTTGDTGGADPVADFSVAIDTLTASFTDLSYDTDGSITAWSWDFGDGSGTSTTQNPTYTYTTEGTYTVKLTVTDNSSRTDIDSLSITVDDSLNVAPLASFTYTKNGLEVTFDGTGSSDADGSIANYNWDFGDGNGGFGSGPTHTYSDSGSYLVRLTVTDGDGAKDSEFQTITVSSTATGGGTNNPPTADFTYTKSGLEVSFTDQSTDSDGSVIQWNWDFGDGNTSSAQNPTHTYGSDGNYTVTLTAFDDSTEIDSYSQTISVSATNQPPTASFTWSATNLSVDFTDQSADPDGFLTNWSWNFGDGSGSNQQNPSHTYGSAGTYNVTLVATDDSSDPDSYSEVVSVTTSDGSAPSAPTISSAHGADGYIVVDWHVNDETDMDYYNVYRGTSTNPTTKIAFVDYGTEWYKDNNVNNGTTYYYRVTAVDVDGNESAYSSNASDNPTAGSIAVPNGRRLHTIVEDFFPSNPYIVGTAGHDQDLSGNHGEIINREFGYVTPANDYKPSHVYPYDGATFDYSEGDNWATNARTYNQVIRVHGGLTPQNSTWAKEDVRTGAELEQYGFDYQSNLYTHLETSHSDVIGWLEPINETVESSGAWRQDKSGTDQWEAPWYKIGVDSDALSTPLYIKQALSAANTYAPSFKYVYNEFWNPTYDAVWNKIKTTVTDYLIGTHNLELDAIGWQGHFNGVGWTDNVSRMNDYRSLVDWAHNNNLGFFITEIDVIVSNAGEYDKQAKVFKDILGVLLEKRNNGFVSFNIWHPNPQANWRGISGDATPFDENYAPKPAYYAIQDTLEDVGRGQ